MKDLSPPLSGCDVPAASDRRILERTRRRRADGDDPPPVALRAGDRLGGLRAEIVVALRIDDVILDAVDAHRLERAVADVQRDFGPLDAALDAASQQRRREVQSGRRRGDRSARAREDRLVALAIGRRVLRA